MVCFYSRLRFLLLYLWTLRNENNRNNIKNWRSAAMIKYEIISTLTDSSQHEIFVGSVGRIILRDNTTYSFHVHAIARASDNSDSSVFEIVGAIKRDSGVASVAFVNSDPLQILPAQESGITRDLTFTADTTNGALGVFATGAGVWQVIVNLFPNPEYTSYSDDYQHYQDELASLIQDDASKLSSDDMVLLLAKAVTDWGRDVPLRVHKKIKGTGTNKYNLDAILTGLWKYGYSRIFGVEYPFGDEPATFLQDEDWDVYDDGTAQDGSNLVLWLINNQPATNESFVVELSIEPVLEVSGVQNFPYTNLSFSQITTLAAAYACQRLATAYAQSVDASISVDVVNYNDKAAKYTTLAKQYFNRYNVLVFGQEEPKTQTRAAMVQKEITPRYNIDSMSQASGGLVSSNYLFHRRKR